MDELVGIEWARIPHFYSNFYVYKYATGFSAASVLSNMILNEEGAVPRYIEFLRSGGSEYPLDQLRHAGVNMEEKSGNMEIINFKLVAWVMLFVVLISIQLTLNKILLLLREIRDRQKDDWKDRSL